MKKILRGSDAMVFIDGEPLALATTCSVEVTTNTIEARTKDSAYGPDAEFDYCSWTSSSEAFVGCNADSTPEQTAGSLLEAQLAGKKVTFAFGVVTRDGTAIPSAGWLPENVAAQSYLSILKGEAWIKSVSITNPNDGKSTVSVQLEGVGPLTIVQSMTANS